MKKSGGKKDPITKLPLVPSVERVGQLRVLLEALVQMNMGFLTQYKKRMGKDYPSLYDVAPKYRGPADLGVWQDIPATARAGAGDACDLVCWRIAELRHAGYEDVSPFLKMTYSEDGTVILTTVQVRIKDVLEDPTAILGGGPITREA